MPLIIKIPLFNSPIDSSLINRIICSLINIILQYLAIDDLDTQQYRCIWAGAGVVVGMLRSGGDSVN